MFAAEAFHSVLKNIARILDQCEIPFLLSLQPLLNEVLAEPDEIDLDS